MTRATKAIYNFLMRDFVKIRCALSFPLAGDAC